MHFADRQDAGRRLAGMLGHLGVDRAADGAADGVDPDIVVLGLPRGGVPVALEIALVPAAPLDVIVVRKLGAPFQPELAMGAIGEGGVRVVDEGVVKSVGATEEEIAAIEARSAPSWRGGRSSFEATPHRSPSRDGLPSSSTTGSRLDRRRESCAGSSAPGVRHGSCSRSPWRPSDGPRSCAARPTSSCASVRPVGIARSASGIAISRRPPTTR